MQSDKSSLGDVWVVLGFFNRESPTQFENRIKPRLYVRRITHSTMYEKAETGVRKLSSVACGLIHYSVNRINEVYVLQ